MAKAKLSERIIAGLLANGFNEVQAKKTNKSRVFTNPKHPDTFYYVGNSGSLRRGKNKVTSIPVNILKARLLQEQP